MRMDHWRNPAVERGGDGRAHQVVLSRPTTACRSVSGNTVKKERVCLHRGNPYGSAGGPAAHRSLRAQWAHIFTPNSLQLQETPSLGQ